MDKVGSAQDWTSDVPSTEADGRVWTRRSRSSHSAQSVDERKESRMEDSNVKKQGLAGEKQRRRWLGWSSLRNERLNRSWWSNESRRKTSLRKRAWDQAAGVPVLDTPVTSCVPCANFLTSLSFTLAVCKMGVKVAPPLFFFLKNNLLVHFEEFYSKGDFIRYWRLKDSIHLKASWDISVKNRNVNLNLFYWFLAPEIHIENNLKASEFLDRRNIRIEYLPYDDLWVPGVSVFAALPRGVSGANNLV